MTSSWNEPQFACPLAVTAGEDGVLGVVGLEEELLRRGLALVGLFGGSRLGGPLDCGSAG